MFYAFSTISVSIFLEGIFFLLVGVLIASILEVFVSEDTIKKLIPRNKIAALLCASALGIIFPICECGIVPVVRKLLKKGVPLHLCVALLFSSPIVNIVVIFSTYFAFQNYIVIVLLRIAGGFIISFVTGLVVSIFMTKEEAASSVIIESGSSCSCCGNHAHSGVLSTLKRIGDHSISEFFDTVKYFIMGILITGLLQSIVPRSVLSNFGTSFPVSNLFMMLYPYILSVCSNTDAFIARSFLGQFSISALTGFMVFGAMFDIKTTIMLSKIFSRKFIIRLLLMVALLTLLYSLLIHIFIDGAI